MLRLEQSLVVDSAIVAARVIAAREVQTARYQALSDPSRPRSNAEADGKLLEKVASPDQAGRALLTQAADPGRRAKRTSCRRGKTYHGNEALKA